MAPIDLIIITVYVGGLFVFGIYTGLRETINDFLVNSRNTKLLLLLASIVSTNVGAATYIGITATSYKSGISYALSILFGVLFGFLFVGLVAPHLRKIGAEKNLETMGDYFRLKYSQRCQLIATAVILIGYFLFTAAQIRAAALMLHHWSGVGIELAIYVAGITMVVYTAFAGIKSDLYTDFIHFVVMAVGLAILVPLSIRVAGGIHVLGALPSEAYSPFSYKGPVFFFGSLVFGLPIMLSSMEIWQRVYAAKDEQVARRVMYLAAGVNVVFIMGPVVLGLIARQILPTLSNPDLTFFRLLDLMPRGLLGLTTAGLLGAILSTANSMIMVLAAVVIKDIVLTKWPAARSNRRFIWTARGLTFVIGMLTLLVADRFGNLVDIVVNGIQVIAVLSPAILGALFSRNPSEPAAFYSMFAGLVLTIVLYPLLTQTAFVPALIVASATFGVLSVSRVRNRISAQADERR